MKAIVIARPGGPEVLELRDVPLPEPGFGQVRVRIRATAVNRADLLQRAGHYPAPPDAPADIPGLELAGEIDALGPGVLDRAIGDRVFGIVSGGAYAEAVVTHARTLAAIPEGIDFVDAAAVPEAFLTAYDAMVLQAGLAAGEAVVVHAAGSGVGTAAVQIALAIGARPIATARTEDKLQRLAAFGPVETIAAAGAPPRFAERVRALTDGRGVSVVLELVGGAYVPESLAALGDRGRLVLVGLVGGAKTELDLGMVLRKRLRIFGTVLRARPLEEKIEGARVLACHLAPLFAKKKLRPVVDRAMPLAEAGAAHAYVASNASFGKVVLTTQ